MNRADRALPQLLILDPARPLEPVAEVSRSAGARGMAHAIQPGVAIRLEVHEQNGAKVIHLSGHLKGADVGVCDDAIAEVSPPLQLDLSELLYADSEGLELLRRLRETGIELLEVPPLLALQLNRSSVV